MKKTYVLLAGILMILVAGIVFFLQQPSDDEKAVEQEPDRIHIDLYSDPFPMAFGSANMMISVTDNQGNPIKDVDVNVVTQELHHGGPEIMTIARQYENDHYIVPVFWSMAGQSSITINVTLPDGQAVSEQYITFIYTSPTFNVESRRYRSERELKEELASIPDNEYWIVVPNGAREITDTHFESFVDPLIKLSVSGKNTLVIRNDDFVDNSIGPFYVGAGETLRQTFYEPAVYQGVCTINQGPVRIEVSE